MFQKDTFRLIGKTFKRFFSLVMIVLIGSSFMMGLMSSRQVMEQSVDRYNDALRLQDVQIYSSYGFDGSDMSAIRKQEWVEHCFGSRMRDVFSKDQEGEVSVTRIEETDRAVNRFELTEGRMPENSSEVLILNNTLYSNSYGIGSTLDLFLEDDDVLEFLECDRVTVVGIARSPAYMSKTMGTSLLNNLDLEIILYALPSAFKSDYYTTVYITVPGAAELSGFSREYASLMDQVKTDIDVFSRKQSQQLKDKLVSEYTEEIEKNEAELAQKKAEAQQKLDEAKAQLDDANIQLIGGQSQLDSLNIVLQRGEDRLDLLKSSYSGEYSGVDEEIAAVEAEYGGRSFDSIYSDVVSDYGTYTALKTMTDPSGTEVLDERISETEGKIVSSRARLDGELYPRRAQLEAVLVSDESTEEEKASAAAELTDLDRQISEEEDDLALNERLLEGLLEMRQAGDSGSAASRMDEIDARYGGSVENEYRRLTRLSRDRIAWSTIREEIQIAEEAVDRVRSQITSLEYELEEGRSKYEEGLSEYQKNLIEFTEAMEKAESEIRKARQDLEELPGATWTILDRDRHYSSYLFSSNAKQMGAIGISMPMLFFLVAALVCLTTMTRLIDEQRGQIGIFRALGFSRTAVIFKYVIYALLASITGSSVGLFAGMAVFPTVIYRTWKLLYDLPSMIISFPVINAVICFFSFSILIAGVTAAVVSRTLTETPSQLMRPKAPKAAKKVFLEYIPFLWKRLSFTGKITARNIIRYKARFFMTVIGVAGCTALLVVGWGVKDSIKDVVNVQFGDINAYQYMVNLENDHDLDGIVETLQSDLDNEYVVPYLKYSTKMYLEDGEEVLEAQIIDARESLNIYNFRSASDHSTPLKLGNSGAILSEKFAQTNGIKEGDYVTVESLNGIKEQVKIAAVCEMYFQHYIFISSEMYEALFGEPVHCNTIAVRSSSSMDDIEASISGREGFLSVVDFTSVMDNFNTMISALDLIIVVIILTAGALAFVVLLNLTQVNISERLREIATLKVLGFRQIEVQSYLFKEIFLLTVIGALFGLPLGYLFHHFIMNVISMDMVKFGMVIRPNSYIYAFAVTIVFSLIVLILTVPSLKKIEMVESLKSVE
ncbi:MAG: ABC transporter permease [Oscillospiraceae bacterium]|nr:ABC transporter permease [Oscillospiraceae bacterium]